MSIPRTTPTTRIPIYLNKHYSSPSIAFETFKKSSAIAEAINSDATLRVCLDVCNPAPSESDLQLAREEIERYVDENYREAVRTGIPATLAASNGLGWDENLWNSVLHSTAGVLHAINDVASGTPVAASLSSGLHHATPSRGSGFCTINSVAVGALAAARGGLKVVILDLDAHCGGGTEAFLRRFPHEAEKIVHVDLSVIPFDRYEPRATGSWSQMATRDSYLADLDQALTMVLAEKPDLVIYNAGIDIWPTIDKRVVHEREARVAQTIVSNGIGCVIVMAGGYGSNDDIVPLHLSTLKSFAKASSKAEEVKSLLAMSMTGPIMSIEPSSRTRIWAASARAGQNSRSRNRWTLIRGTIPIRFRPPIIHGWINLD
jgi:acetoin utilization deacetylase AcuC-like enzyme